MKKRLLTIGHSYVVALNRALMREIQARGEWEVTVLAPEFFHGDLRSLEMEPEPAGSRLKVKPIACRFSKKIHFFFYDRRELRRALSEDFDYFYLWEEPYIVAGFQVARELQRLGKPYSIFTAQNIVKNYPWPFSYFEKRSLRGSNAVWPCGVTVDEVLQKKGFGDLHREVVPLAVDLERFRSVQLSARDVLKDKLGLRGEKTIGFMGRFTPEKGCRVFMRACDELLKERGNTVLMIGSGPLENEIRSWGARYGERVKVISLVHAAVPTVLPVMDVILCPSQPTSFWLEQFGRMIVEAMACGVPVVGSRSGEIPFVIGDAGLVVDPQDVAGWVEAAQKILSQDILAKSLQNKGVARAEDFSANHLAPLVEKKILAGLGRAK